MRNRLVVLLKPATRPPSEETAIPSAERVYLNGWAADKKSHEQAARAAYDEALKLDPGYAPAHIALGLSFYRPGESEASAGSLG